MLEIRDNDIGGARIVRTFTMNGKYTKRGENLTAEQVLGIALPNRRALIDSNFIEVYPKAAPVGGERFIVAIGKNQFNVIEGRILNAEPLTHEEAKKLLKG
jgi:hypothetical protein